jgi:hypothetical protein
VAAVNPKGITGRWLKVVALDVHTVRSTYMGVNEFGHDVFDTVRSELGDLLVRLKYRGDQSAAAEIIATAAEYLKPYVCRFDRIVPVPPSAGRAVQPVIVLANGIGQSLGIPFFDCVTTTRPSPSLKMSLIPLVGRNYWWDFTT